MSIKSNLNMYLDFFKGLARYKNEIKASSKWIQKYAESEHLALNPDKMYLKNLQIWLAENKTMTNKNICPCFEHSEDNLVNQAITCPCTYIPNDILNHGTCHCNLFGDPNLSKADWKAQNKRIMSEYRIPLEIVGKTVYATPKSVDASRGLPIPDAMHQFKQSLNQISLPFQIQVESKQSAENISVYAKLRGLRVETVQKENHYLVFIK